MFLSQKQLTLSSIWIYFCIHFPHLSSPTTFWGAPCTNIFHSPYNKNLFSAAWNLLDSIQCQETHCLLIHRYSLQFNKSYVWILATSNAIIIRLWEHLIRSVSYNNELLHRYLRENKCLHLTSIFQWNESYLHNIFQSYFWKKVLWIFNKFC